MLYVCYLYFILYYFKCQNIGRLIKYNKSYFVKKLFYRYKKYAKNHHFLKYRIIRSIMSHFFLLSFILEDRGIIFFVCKSY